ncbi:MAG: hypothetical protein IJW36_00955 [Clostridia bacterium]|nr:hypothetical protein [Clostridia bacterium]
MVLLILSLIFNSYLAPVNAAESKTYFAKVLFEQVYLYKSPVNNNEMNNIYFELPKTYFVELLSSHGTFYEARYLNTIGYVKKDSVQAIQETPNNPFLTNISFRVYAELSQNLCSSPTANIQTSNLITTIPNLTRNITYIAKIHGECLIEGRTDIWYYCKYSSTQDYYGYVYSDFCDEMPNILDNTEEVTFITNPTFEKPQQQTDTIPITSNSVGIVIGILSIPALIFVFLLIKGTRIIPKEKFKNKEVIDY